MTREKLRASRRASTDERKLIAITRNEIASQSYVLAPFRALVPFHATSPRQSACGILHCSTCPHAHLLRDRHQPTSAKQEMRAIHSILSVMNSERYSGQRKRITFTRRVPFVSATLLCLLLVFCLSPSIPGGDASVVRAASAIVSVNGVSEDDSRPLPAHLTAARVARDLAIVGAVSLLDDALYAAVHDSTTPARAAFFARTTHLGDGLTALAVAASLWPFDPDTAELVGKASLRAGLTTTALKLVISRGRPYESGAECAQYHIGMTCVSMPSGHTATAFSVAHVLAHQYPRQKALFYGLALLAGWSRVETANHWPSDVAAGALVGLWSAESTLRRSGSLVSAHGEQPLTAQSEDRPK